MDLNHCFSKFARLAVKFGDYPSSPRSAVARRGITDVRIVGRQPVGWSDEAVLAGEDEPRTRLPLGVACSGQAKGGYVRHRKQK